MQADGSPARLSILTHIAKGVLVIAFWTRERFLVLFLGLASAALAGHVVAQDDSSNSDPDGSEKFADQLWNYLLSNNYKHWSPANGNEVDHYVSPHMSTLGFSADPNNPIAHGTRLKSYANRTAQSQAGTLPIGSIVILENYRQDSSLASISVMYRTKGFDPEARDWYWVRYNPDGSVAAAPQTGDTIVGKTIVGSKGTQATLVSSPVSQPAKLYGRVHSCIQCHQKAAGGDLVFFNDKTIGPAK